MRTSEDEPVPSKNDGDVWESACSTIKTLGSLRHFTLVLTTGYKPEAVPNLLRPLKDLCLRQPWALRTGGSRDDFHAVDTALTTAGFDDMTAFGFDPNMIYPTHSTCER